MYHVNAKNATVVIKIELLQILLNVLFLLKKVLFFSFLAHFCTISKREHMFYINYTKKIKSRRKSEFLPTLPMKYDHCGL